MIGDARAVYDSMESHMTMFETQSKAIELNEAESEKKRSTISILKMMKIRKRST